MIGDAVTGAFCWGLPIVVVVIAALAALGKAQEMKEKQERARSEMEEARRAREEQEREEKRKTALRLAREADAARREEETRRQEEEAERLAQRAREAALERFRASNKDVDLEELDRWLKNSQLSAERMGRVLTVRVLAAPTGYVGIEWMADPRFTCPLRVQCQRGSQVLFEEHASQGSFIDIVSRGRDHLYRFHAYDGRRDEEPDFSFVVRVPTPRQWARKIERLAPAAEDASQREERLMQKARQVVGDVVLREKLRREVHEAIDAAEGSDIEKRRKKAAADTRLQEIWDEEERKGK